MCKRVRSEADFFIWAFGEKDLNNEQIWFGDRYFSLMEARKTMIYIPYILSIHKWIVITRFLIYLGDIHPPMK